MQNLENLIQNLESKIVHFEKVSETVSASTVGWQIEHSLLTINMIVSALQNPRTEYKWSFKMPRLIVFTLKKIPRGKAKAPNRVIPQDNITIDSINKQLILAKENVKLLDTLNADLFFEHPFFGHLKVKQTKKFLAIHTNHHLNIIEDIIKV